ncbi:CrcB family protein [Methanoregula sp.]|uniref:CrcB family protein n=1 Tax=Methanoregula sp. TaxID=2052170 RepID=UPI003C172111
MSSGSLHTAFFHSVELCIAFAAVAFGGFIGAVLRYLVDTGIVLTLPGTLVVNTTGCFFLGIFMYESMYLGRFSQTTRQFCAVGIIGSYTTFSALEVQSFAAGPLIGVANLVVTLLLGFFAIWLGRLVILYRRFS